MRLPLVALFLTLLSCKAEVSTGALADALTDAAASQDPGPCVPQCPKDRCQDDGCGGTCPACGDLPAPYGTRCVISGSPDAPAAMKVVNAFPALTFAHPVQLTSARDGTDRVWVVEKTGKIKVFPNKPDVTATEVVTYFDKTGQIDLSHSETGLLSITFHPAYATNRRAFLNYNVRRNGTLMTVISRVEALAQDPNRADPNSEVELLTFKQPYANHNGGGCAFGPDGMLYIGTGDGGSAGDPDNNGQSLTTYLGKMLRIDVNHATYAIPKDNPLVGAGNGALPEIWAWGLRNPWRFSFDRVAGDLWAGDVGQGLWEEVDIVKKGKNYGWRPMEGNHCYKPPTGCDPSKYEPPVLEYDHGVGKSITGGHVYRGKRLPSLYGSYVYGDYVSGVIFAARWNEKDELVPTKLVDSGLSIASFGEDDAGELYIADYPYFSPDEGRILRFEVAAPTPSPGPAFPLTLSETGCFLDLTTLTPAAGLIPYEVNSPLWHDGAGSVRYLALPNGSKITTRSPDAWTLPVGTRLIKTFTYPKNGGGVLKVETRFLLHEPDGWRGYAYRWNAAQTDAELLSGAAEGDVDLGGGKHLTWHFPSRSQCLVCHNEAAGRVLGWRTGQLERQVTLGKATTGNQVDLLAKLGVLTSVPTVRVAYPDPADTTAPLAARARSALFANCGSCHLANGPTTTPLDLRFETPLTATAACQVQPQKGDLGVPGATILEPGHPERSTLWLRMKVADTTSDLRMPNLGSALVDQATVDVVSSWLTALKGCAE